MTTVPRLSIVIPARNEEFELGATLDSVRVAAEALSQPWECIVVNDGSTDRTADIGREKGMRVVDVELHNIGAVRNAGAAAALGERHIFLDADTRIPPETLRAAWQAMEHGAVGGGGWVRFDQLKGSLKIPVALFAWFWLRLCRWAAGCFIFCKKEAFEAVGGFDETYFASEERFISQALKRVGRFVILREHVVTSSRKARLYSVRQLLSLAFRALLGGRKMLMQREGLEIFYDAPRESSGS